MSTRKKILFVGDAACPSGFARATHEILKALLPVYDIVVLGMNYRGDPHPYPYPIYAAFVGGDPLGVGRLIWMMDAVKPDLIILQNDFWHIPRYMRQLKRFGEYSQVPVIGYIAVDGKNVQGDTLNDLTLAIFWTEFARQEAIAGGCTVPTAVVPLGVDTSFYRPMDRVEARAPFNFKMDPAKPFIVGNVNRNQPRKRFDLVVRYFAKWIHEKHVDDAYLMLHVAPTGDEGFDVKHLARYYGIYERLITIEPEVWYGVSEDQMRFTYCAMDVFLTATQGEGFGLTTFEAMACGVPVIAPDWSALGELCQDAAMLVPCTSTAATIGGSIIGGIMDERQTIEALDLLYRDKTTREHFRNAGIDRTHELRFNWLNVGRAFRNEVNKVMVPQEVGV